MANSTQRWSIPVALAAGLTLLACNSSLFFPEREPPASPLSESRISSKHVPSPEEIASPHLKRAEERIANATSTHFGSISRVFNRGRNQSDAFAQTALGWGSKWRMVADSMPFTQGGKNEAYLRQQFEDTVLRADDLEHAVTQAVTEFLAEIRSIENEMLVDLRLDCEDFPNEYSLAHLNAEQLQACYEEAIEQARQISGTDLRSNISSQLVSIIVGEVFTQIAVRMGVSAGILGTGAASGWATLGVGVVVGLVIDHIVMKIWNYWSDPTGNLTGIIIHQLDVMESAITQGSESSKGLRQHFEEIAAARAELRHTAVLQLFKTIPSRPTNPSSPSRTQP